jgi:hypothetical protein
MSSPRSIEARLQELERSAGVFANGPRVLEVWPTNPGFIGSPRVRAEFYGQTLHRLDDEAEDAFRLRATAAAKAAAPAGCTGVLLILHGAEPPMQWCDEGGVVVARPIAECGVRA